MIIVIMGVAGAGKSTVGQLLAAELHCEFLDGDSLHPPANIEKMTRGIPLTDADRAPWLAAIHARIVESFQRGGRLVVACSALKQQYRDTLERGVAITWVYLKGSENVIQARLQHRQHHFMKAAMLASQFADLEEPGNSIVVDVAVEPSVAVGQIVNAVLGTSQGKLAANQAGNTPPSLQPGSYLGGTMKAARILHFGSPSVIVNANIPRPEPRPSQLLVRVQAAGVGPWDALIREGKSAILQQLPLTLGSDLAGVVEAMGPGVSGFEIGEEVYGVTNDQFTGAYAEYALASAGRMARKPRALSFIEAASAPVVSVTAWQMLFDYAQVTSGQTVLIHGAAGNVGAYAVQLAKHGGVRVIATAAARDVEYVRSLGAETVVDYTVRRFEDVVGAVDAVIDTVGGETRQRSFQVIKRGGILVSAVSPIPPETPKRFGIRAIFFLVEVTTAKLNAVAELFERGELVPHVGSVLALEQARTAHEMLAGAVHKPGKIVLRVAA